MSANTAEMTYAATAPRFGVWSSQVPTIVPKGLSIGERARFYERETLKNLSTNPGFYARNVMIHAVRCARNLPGERWAMLLGVVLLSLHAARKDLTRAALVRLAAAAALLCAGLAWLPSQYLCLLWGAGLILALARRHLMALPATLLGVSVASLALVALSGGGRFLDSLDWLATAVSLWTCAQLVHAARDLAFPARPEASPPWGRAARPFILAALLGGALLLVGLGRALIAHARPVVPTPPVVLAPAEAVAWIAAVLDGPEAGDYASLRPRLEARRGVIRAGYRAHLDAGETAIHWNPLFGKRRSYAVDIFELCWYGSLRLENRAVQCIPENFAVIPGDVRRLAGTEVVLVGISVTRPLEGSSFETIALIPAGPKPAAIVLAPRDVRSAHAADLVRMAGGPQ